MQRAAATKPAIKPVPAKKSTAKKVPASVSPDSAVTIDRLTDSLRKMGDKRPTKAASLWRSLKSFLGAGATEEAVEVALHRLIEDGVVKVDSVNGASYSGSSRRPLDPAYTLPRTGAARAGSAVYRSLR